MPLAEQARDHRHTSPLSPCFSPLSKNRENISPQTTPPSQLTLSPLNKYRNICHHKTEYKYYCGRPTTVSASTQSVNTETASDIPGEETIQLTIQPRSTERHEPGLTSSYSRNHRFTYIIGMAVVLPLAFVAGLFWYLKRKKREFKWSTYYRDGSGDNQEIVVLEGIDDN
ncbi:uncharacterized protein LOC144605516 [Rhinoraja longicauda]